MQRRLAQLGYLSGTPDGVFGTETKKAILEFQKTSGLTADGIAGAATLGALLGESAAAKPAAAATPQQQTEKKTGTVYVWITKTGTKYHRTDHCGNTK
ncbi:MAG: peptidoglycan-binding protein [Clostridiales bacterium]|nr:peptidoglycan-binding protein [Clostridiales bacterium]